MTDSDRRRYLRYETEMRAVLYVKDESIAAIMIDIGKCCIGLISEKEITPGTEVRILIKHVEEFTIRGTVVWMEKIRELPSTLYRMGVETTSVIVLNEIAETGFPERSEHLKSLLTEKRPVKSVLIIDDEEMILKLFKEALEKFGYEVTVAVDGEEGMRLFREHPVDLVITDIFMPKKDGHQLIFEIKQEFPNAKVFAITGKNTILGIEYELDLAKKLGAMRGFTKPFKLKEVLEAIKEL